ncbi:glycosyltransferase family 4 protein [Acidobacterium sp. S8]|uniref:glycosyltransferase family 4 protein n=1 Tax=Acidobacterium sp. S8 TaxID=1641854 RepID=UPI00131BABEB|nr:glycosyltransferase family 4 protein [Acidobacterium sp. S8]
MRIAVLWTRLSGYLNACLKELHSRSQVELFVTHQVPATVAPFEEEQVAWIKNRLTWRSQADLAGLNERLWSFSPEILVVSGWAIPRYRQALKENRGRCFRIMTMDNCWLATPRQWFATMIARAYLQPLADAVWLPGERQAIFARKLGFVQRAILGGLYSCDQVDLEAMHVLRVQEGRHVPRQFLFVGRFVPEKGIDTLVRAYQDYHAKSAEPWPLVCCGAGPLLSRLEGQPGITVEGFLQPQALRAKFGASGCLVLPSEFEPWAVVVHEATSAGLLVLASDKVGSVVHLVQDKWNGYVFDSNDVKGLSSLMTRIEHMNDRERDAMSRASNLLSKQFSPTRWADTLLQAGDRGRTLEKTCVPFTAGRHPE